MGLEYLTMTTPAQDHSRFPLRLFVGGVAVICIALVISAAYGYSAMMDLRALYLQDRARQAEIYLTEQLRGPDRLNPDRWRLLMDDAVRSGSFPWLKYLALVDESKRILVASGQPAGGLYEYESGVHAPGRGFQGGGFGRPQSIPESNSMRGPRRLTLTIGIDPSSASFISRQANVSLVISLLTVITMAGLSFYLLRTFRNFVELKAKEESQRRLAALGTMSATLAHEIRNPLGAIKGLSQVTLERSPDDATTQELVSTVVQEAERLERLVTDLLSFARPRAVAPFKLDVCAIISEVSEGLRPQAEAKQVCIEFPDGRSSALVAGDADGLRQVFYNVIINALEASPVGGSVDIHVSRTGGRFDVTVLDAGRGFGDQNPEQLFQPFVTGKVRGTGLGLPVSRQILESLGGTIRLEKRRALGTICRISLPVWNESSGRESHRLQDSVIGG